MQERRFIIIRKLAALDVVFRGRRRALLEFGFSVFFPMLLGMAFFAFAAHPSPEIEALAVYLLLLGLNYVPLFVYSILIPTVAVAREEAAFELEHADVYRTRYGAQQLLILVPLSILLLSIVQEAEGSRSRAS